MADKLDIFEALINDLNNNDDWVLTRLGADVLVNTRNKVSIWMDNIPVLNTNVHKPNEMSLGLIKKFRLYRAAKRAMDRNVFKELLKENNHG